MPNERNLVQEKAKTSDAQVQLQATKKLAECLEEVDFGHIDQNAVE
jgi:hypothetical protein